MRHKTRSLTRMWLVVFTFSLCLPGCGGCGSSKPKDTPAAPAPAAPKLVAAAPPPAPVAAPEAAPAGPPPPKPTSTPGSAPPNEFLYSAAGTEVELLDQVRGTVATNVFQLEATDRTYSVGKDSAAPKPEDYLVVESIPVTGDSAYLRVVQYENKRPVKGPTVSLPEGFTAIAKAGATADGVPMRITSPDGAEMALIPAGVGYIGSTDGPANSRPELTVMVDYFYMDIHEVTVQQYSNFREAQKQKKKNSPAATNATDDPLMPVLGIPWGVAQVYAKTYGKELPTEAEWEKAARGPEGFRAPWGNGRAAWSEPRTHKTITKIASFPPDYSPYGIYDLAGNAREWCADWYAESAHVEFQSSKQPLRNWSSPKKATTTNYRLVKGAGPDWAVWKRVGQDMQERLPDVGFRTVLRLPSSDTTKGRLDEVEKVAKPRGELSRPGF